MTTDTATAPGEPIFDLADWLGQHRTAALCLGTFCLWVSLCLILRLWLVHRRAGLAKRLVWSLVLLVPFLGWLLYGAFFHPLGRGDTPCPTGNSWDGYGSSGDGGSGGFDGGIGGHH